MHCMHLVKLAVSPLLLVRHAWVETPPIMDPSHAQLMIRTLVAESQGKSGKVRASSILCSMHLQKKINVIVAVLS